MRKLIVVVVGLAALVGVLATATGISLSPLLTDIVLPLGATYSDAIYITNTGDKPMVVSAQAVGYIMEDGVPRFLDPAKDTYPYSGKDLLTIEPAELTVQPGESVTFTYRLSMPEDLTPYGGRYVAAVFWVKPEAESEAQVMVSARVASLFLINPGGDVAPHLKFENLKIYQSPIHPRTVVLEAQITNDGKVHLNSDQVAGRVFVTDEDGYFLDEFNFCAHHIILLPGNVRVWQTTWEVPEDLPSGVYQFHLDILVFGPAGTEPQRYLFSAPVELNF